MHMVEKTPYLQLNMALNGSGLLCFWHWKSASILKGQDGFNQVLGNPESEINICTIKC